MAECESKSLTLSCRHRTREIGRVAEGKPVCLKRGEQYDHQVQNYIPKLCVYSSETLAECPDFEGR